MSTLDLSEKQIEGLDRLARIHGYDSAGAYLVALAEKGIAFDVSKILADAREQPLYRRSSTEFGEIWEGDALSWMTNQPDSSLDLIMTSPPFGLIRKKSYGNEASDDYCNWFRPFAEEFRRLMKDTGSLVIDIGGAWEKGKPVRSLYHYDLLTMLVREYGFFLCLEHYWYNPAKLPSPVEWCNLRRVRVKDAVNCVWWLSKTPWPKCSNMRVLQPYSDRMKNLHINGYQATIRPSGHDISDKFRATHKGAIPPNLLAIPNTESNSAYSQFCRENGYPIHPARFPAKLPEYFIRMLTDKGDRVYDPFSGSFTTGRVCEELGRNWIGTEMREDYIQGGLARFKPGAPNILSSGLASARYLIYPPCAMGDTDDVPLTIDGGRHRPVTTAEKTMEQESAYES